MIQVQQLDRFTIVTNEVLKNPKLSLKAKGLYSYLVSNAADFVVYMSEVEKHSTDGKDGHRAAWNELSKAGWISSVKTVGAGGKFDGWDHTIITDKESYKYPTKSTEMGLSDIGFSDVGKPATNKYQQVINTNSNKKGGQKPPTPTKPKKSPIKSKTTFPDDFLVTDKMQAWFLKENYTIDIKAATERWADAMIGNGTSKKDWIATWRNGMRIAQKWDNENKAKQNGIDQRRTNRDEVRAALNDIHDTSWAN